MDVVLCAASLFWIWAHCSDWTRYSGWFEIPSLVRPAEGCEHRMDTEIVLLVKPRPDVAETSFYRALEESCSSVAGELETYPDGLVHGVIVPDPSDFGKGAIRLVRENGLANVVMDQRMGAVVGCVEAERCEKQPVE